MKISKSNRNSDSKEVFLHKLIFYFFLTLSFIVKADNNNLVSSTYDLSNNLISNSFIGSVNPLSIQDETKTICSDEQLGVIFDFTNSEGIPYPSFNILINESETDSELIPSSSNRGAGFELTSNQTLNDSFTNLTSRTLKVVYYIRPTNSNGILIEGDEFNLIFFINPEPEVDSQSIDSICSEIPLDITLNDSKNGVIIASYNIIEINNNILISTTGNISTGTGFSKTALTRDSYTNTSSSVLDVIYTVVPVSEAGCEGDPFLVKVPILPSPKVADQTKTVCRNQPIEIYLGNDTNGPSALRYNITNINSNGLTASAGSPEVKYGISNAEIFDDAWSNPTSAPIDVVYSVEPEGQNCIGDSFTVTVTVNPELSIADQVIEVCSGEQVGVDFNASSTIPAAKYNITNLVLNGLTVVSGNPSISSGLSADDLSDDTFNNPTTEDITAVYTVVPFDAIGCEGTSFGISVTVKPDNLVPVVANQIASSNVSSRDAINIKLNPGTKLNAPAVYYRIKGINSIDLTAGSNNKVVNDVISENGIFNDSYTNLSLSLIDVIYTIVPISTEGCEGDSFTVTVAINPEPVVADQEETVCNEQDLGVTLNGSENGVAVASYNIIGINTNGLQAGASNSIVSNVVSADALENDTYTNNSNSLVDVVYTIVPVSSGGVEGGSFTVTVTVNPVPVVSAQTETVCSDDTLTLDLNAGILSGGDSFKYIIDQVLIPSDLTRTGPSSYGTGSDALNGDSFTNTTSAPVEVVYTVTPYIEIPGDAADCGGAEFTVTVTVNSAPVVADITDTVNSGDVIGVTLGADTDGAPAISNYRITGITTNGLEIGLNNSVNNSTISSDGIFNDSYTNLSLSLIDVIYTIVPISTEGCEGDSFTVTVAINPEPVVADQEETVCNEQDLGVTLNGSENGVAVASYNIIGINTNGLQAGASNSIVSNVVSADALENDTYTNNSNSLVDVVYTIVPVSSGGVEGGSFTVTVTVNPVPVVSAQTETVCSDDTLTLDLNAGILSGGDSFKYIIDQVLIPSDLTRTGPSSYGTGSDALNGDSFTNTTSAPVEVVYTVTPYIEIPGDAADCGGAEFTVTVTVNSAPVVADITDTVNSGDVIGVTLGADTDGAPAISNYRITGITTNGLEIGLNNSVNNSTISSDGIFNDSYTNLSLSLIDVIYTIVPISTEGCEGDSFTVTVAINPEPVVADQEETVCNEQDLGVTLNGSENGVAVASYNIIGINTNGLQAGASNSIVSNVVSADALENDTYTNNSNSLVDVVYTIVPVSSGGVEGGSFTVTVTVNPVPVVSAQTETVCSDDTLTLDLNAGILSGGDSFKYIIDQVLIPSDLTRTGPSSYGTGSDALNGDSFTNTTSAPVEVVYTVTPYIEIPGDAADCGGAEFTVTVTVNSAPVVADITDTVNSGDVIGVTLGADTDGAPAISNYRITGITTNGLEIGLNNSVNNSTISSDGIFNDSYTNLSLSLIDVIYTIVPISTEGCEGDSFTVTVAINPEPVVADQEETVCNEQDLGVTLNGSENGVAVASYNIIGINTNGLQAGASNSIVSNVVSADALENDTYTNNSNSLVDVVYTIVPVSSGGVEGGSFTVTVTVNPVPVVSAQTETVCSDDTLTLDLNAGILSGGDSFKYIIDQVLIPSDLTRTGPSSYGTGSDALNGDSFTNTTSAPVEVVYTVTPYIEIPGDAADCGGAEFTVTVTVNSAPVVADITDTVNSGDVIGVTLGADTDGAPAISNYRITGITTNGLEIGLNNSVNNSTISSDGIFNDSYTNLSLSLIDVIYTIVPISTEGCEGDSFTVTVAINPEPVVADQEETVCNEQDLGVTLNGSENGVAVASYNIIGINTNGLQAGASNSIVSNVVSADALENDTYTNNSNSLVDVVYTIVPVSSGGVEGGSFTVTVTVNPVPVVSAQTETVCSDDTLTLDLNAGILSGGDSFKYIIDQVLIPSDLTRTGPSSYGTGSDALNGDSFTNTTSAPVEVVYTVTPYIEIPGDAADCGGAEFTVTVTVNSAPVVADITDTVNSGDVIGVTLGADTDGAPAISNYRITGITTNGLEIGLNNSVNNSTISSDGIFNDSYTNLSLSLIDVIYTIVPISTEGCEGDSFTVTVAINPEPVVADQEETVCNEQDLGVTLNGSENGVAVASYNIIGINTNGLQAGASNSIVSNVVSADALENDTYTNNSNSLVDVVYTIVPVSSGGVEGGSFTVTVTVNPVPVVSAQTETVCSDDTLTLDLNAGILSGGDSFKYIIDQVLIPSDLTRTGPSSYGTGSDALNGDSFTNTTSAPVEVVYTVTPYIEIPGDAADCGGAEFTVTVTVNSAPVVADITDTVNSGDVIGVTLGADTDGAPAISNYRITGITTNGLEIGLNNSVNNSTISSDGIFNDSYTNLSLSLIDVIYTIVPISTEGCEGDSFTVTVAINPEPVVADQEETVCNEQDLGVTLNGSENGVAVASYNIIGINTNGLQAGASNSIVSNVVSADALENDTYTNNSNSLVDVVYTIVPVSSGGVEGGSFTVTVTVNPVPVVSAQTETVCSDDTLTLDLNAGILSGGDSFKYIIDQVLIPSDLTRTGPSSYGTGSDALNGDSFTNTTSAPVEVVYTVTPYIEIPGDAADCGGAEFTVTVTVNSAPVVADITDTVNSGDVIGVTLGADTDGAPAISNYRITGITTNGLEIGLNNSVNNSTISSDGIFNDSYTNLSLSLIDVIYTIVPISTEGCEGDSFTVTVAINPEPVVADQEETVCNEQDLGVTLNGSENGVAVASYNIIGINTNGLQAGASNSIVSNVVSADALENDTYTNNSNSLVDVVYTIVPVSSGGVEGGSFTVTVTVNPVPVVSAQTETVCSDDTLTLDLNAGILSGGDSFKYIIDQVLIPSDLTRTGPSSYGTGSDALNGDSFTNTTSAPVEVVYTVTPYIEIPGDAADCGGAEFTVTVTVNSAPVVADITDTVNSGDVIGVTLGADTDGAPAISNYRITGITTNGLEIGLNNSVNNSTISSDGIFNDSYTNLSLSLIDVIYTIVPISTEGCEGDSFTVTVAINPEPVVADQEETVCNEQDLGVTLNGSENGVAVASYNIIGINTNGLQAGASNSIVSNVVSADALENDTYTNNSNSLVDVVYTIVPVSSGGVEGGSFTVTVTVNPVPVVSAQTETVCSDDTLTLDLNAGILSGGDSFKYIIDQVLIPSDLTRTGPSSYGTGSDALNGDSFTNTTSAPVEVVYTVTPYIEIPGDAADCGGAEFTVTVTVNSAPVVADITDTVNSGDVIGVTLGADTDGAPAISNYRITGITTNGLEIGLNNSVNNSTISSDGIFNDSYTNLSLSLIDVIYTIVPISTEGCEGDSFTVTVAINPEPVVADQEETVCNEQDLGVTLNGSENGVAVASYNIIGINTNGLQAGASNSIVSNVVSADALENDTYTNNSNNPVDVVYTIVPVSSGGVEGVEFTVSITVNPKPIVTAQEVEVCSGEILGVDFNASTTIDVDSYSITGILIDGTESITNINVIDGFTTNSGNPVLGTQLAANEIADDSFTNTTGTSVEVVYTVVPYDAIGCNGDSFTVTVTVNPQPDVADQIATPVSSRAALGVTTLGSDTNGLAFSNYRIADINNNGLTAGSNNKVVNDVISENGILNDTYINKTSVTVNVIYSIVPISTEGCEGDSFTVTVAINPEPVVANQDVTVCSDEAIGVTLNPSSSVAVASFNIIDINANGLQAGTSNSIVSNVVSADALENDTYTNNSNNPVDVVYTIVPVSSGGVEGVEFTVSITVNPKPIVTAQEVEVCSGEILGVDFNASIGIDAATYNITVLNLNGLIVNSGAPSVGFDFLPSDLSDDSFVNETGVPVDVVYTVLPVSSEGCEGEPFTVTVTVNSAPVVADITDTVNSGDVIGVTLGADTDGAPAISNYRITGITTNGLERGLNNSVNNSTILSDGIFNDSYTNTSSSLIDVIYSIVPISTEGCEGDSFTVTVAINPEPVVANQDVTVCSDEAIGVTLNPSSSVAVASFNIIDINANGLQAGTSNSIVSNVVSADALENDTYTNNSNNPVDVVYTIVPVSSGGVEGVEFTVSITVNPKPIVTAQEVEVCSGEILGVDFNASTTIDVDSYSITGILIDGTESITNINVIDGFTTNSGNPVLGTQLAANEIADDSFTNTTGTSVEVVYTVVPYDAIGCNGDSFTVTVTVNPQPDVADQIATPVSSRAALGVTTLGSDTNGLAFSNYRIADINNNGLTAGSNNKVVNDVISENGILNDTYINKTSVTVNVIYSIVPISTEGCEGDSFTVTVAINPEPVVANQDVTVCSDEAIGVTLNPSSSVAVASFNIIDINANGLQAGTSNSIVSNVVSADALENDTYTNNSNNPVDVVYTIVPVSSGGVEGVEFTVSITVNPKPIVTAQEVEVCSGEILGVDFNASIGIDAATYNITVLNLNGLIVNSGAPSVGFDFLPSDLSDDSFVNETGVPVDVVYTVLPVSSEGCEGEPFTVTVTVNSAPVVADITDTVNSGDVIGVTLGADTDGAPAISNYRITGITTNGLERGLNNSVNNSTILSDGIFNDSYTNTSSSLIDVIYSIVPISTEGCEGDSFTVTVAINPEPVVANQDVTVCSDEAIGVTLNPSSSVAVASFNIIDINANGLQAGTSNSIVSNVVSADALENDTYTNNSNNPVDVVYTIVPVSSGGVEGVEFTVSITVNPKPIVTAQEVEVCSGEILGVDFNASIGIDAATYNITVLNLNGLIVNSGAPSVGFDFLPSDLSDDSFANDDRCTC